MTKEALASLSNLAITLAAIGYFVAFLAHLAEWAARRGSLGSAAGSGRPASRRPEPATAAVGAAPAPLEEPVPSGAPEAPGGRGTPGGSPGWAGRLAALGVTATGVAAVPHLVSLVSRGLAADPVRVPWGNMYEFTLTATFVVVALYLGLRRRMSLDWLGPVVTGFVVTVLMVAVLVLYVPPVSLTPALHSPWLVIHVIAAIIATGAFTVGGMASVLYLLKERHEQRRLAQGAGPSDGYLSRLPSLPALDRLAYRMHAFGFPVWTFAALIAGPIWAHYAWSRYWGWDQKEIWAFVTWVVYAAYLHARATAGWRGRKASWVALLGLATLWFNFVGINFFFGAGSLHSYAG